MKQKTNDKTVSDAVLQRRAFSAHSQALRVLNDLFAAKDKTMSFIRYNRYKSCRSIGDALQAGATLKDLEFDYQRGYMELENVTDCVVF